MRSLFSSSEWTGTPSGSWCSSWKTTMLSRGGVLTPTVPIGNLLPIVCWCCCAIMVSKATRLQRRPWEVSLALVPARLCSAGTLLLMLFSPWKIAPTSGHQRKEESRYLLGFRNDGFSQTVLDSSMALCCLCSAGLGFTVRTVIPERISVPLSCSLFVTIVAGFFTTTWGGQAQFMTTEFGETASCSSGPTITFSKRVPAGGLCVHSRSHHGASFQVSTRKRDAPS